MRTGPDPRRKRPRPLEPPTIQFFEEFYLQGYRTLYNQLIIKTFNQSINYLKLQEMSLYINIFLIVTV